ncbi:thermonuclease family protein [Deferrisoma sp.]
MVFWVLLGLAAAARADMSGRVVAVADGDTLTVLVGTEQVRVRLAGIDCPERRQPFGRKAKEFASRLAFGQVVRVRGEDRDRYGRVVGEVILPDGRSLNRELVSAGLAWWYRRYAPDDADLARREAEARAARRGLWADAAPVPPWEYRRSRRRTGRG